MTQRAPIFKENYGKYLDHVAQMDFALLPERLGVEVRDDTVIVPVFGKPFQVAEKEVIDPSGRRAGYSLCVILCKYLLLCPNFQPVSDEWLSFKDFKSAGPLVTYFSDNVEGAISAHFSGRTDVLQKAAALLGCRTPPTALAYDFAACFDPLPRVPLLLVFNDADEEFEAGCSVLFEKRAENYLDMECLAMVGSLFAESLKTITD